MRGHEFDPQYPPQKITDNNYINYTDEIKIGRLYCIEIVVAMFGWQNYLSFSLAYKFSNITTSNLRQVKKI